MCIVECYRSHSYNLASETAVAQMQSTAAGRRRPRASPTATPPATSLANVDDNGDIVNLS